MMFWLRCMNVVVSQTLYYHYMLCRGENGELRVGVRRLAHQQSSMPSSVISSQSMHLGVLATAAHAVKTSTLFIVYYKPRFLVHTCVRIFLSWSSCFLHLRLSFASCFHQNEPVHNWFKQVSRSCSPLFLCGHALQDEIWGRRLSWEKAFLLFLFSSS